MNNLKLFNPSLSFYGSKSRMDISFIVNKLSQTKNKGLESGGVFLKLYPVDNSVQYNSGFGNKKYIYDRDKSIVLKLSMTEMFTIVDRIEQFQRLNLNEKNNLFQENNNKLIIFNTIHKSNISQSSVNIQLGKMINNRVNQYTSVFEKELIFLTFYTSISKMNNKINLSHSLSSGQILLFKEFLKSGVDFYFKLFFSDSEFQNSFNNNNLQSNQF